MDNDLLTSFLETLKEVNGTLIELTKITAHNQLAVKLIGLFLGLGFAGFMTWLFANLDTIIHVAKPIQ